MDEVFIYSKPVTGKNFIGRKPDVTTLCNLLVQGENVVIYEPPRTGKMSLISQSFFNLQSSGTNLRPVAVNLLDVRSPRALAERMVCEILRSFCTTEDEFSDALVKLLPEGSFSFNSEGFEAGGNAVSLNSGPDDELLRSVFTLPYRTAGLVGCKMIVVLNEFQNVMLTGDGDRLCRILQEVLKSLEEEDRGAANYIFSGSCINAMHDIFGVRKLFFRTVERIRLSEIDSREIIDYVSRSLLSSGKVIDKDLLHGVCTLFRNHIWYINHFSAICDLLSKGYIMEIILSAALENLQSIHEPRFKSIMNDLTTFQINMLKAILCGYTRFNGSEIIEQFGLSSSANVSRLKDALSKKEIVSFQDEGRPVVIDPLFEHWARTKFFRLR